MRRDDDIGQVPVRAGRVERLFREHIERGASQPAVAKRLDNREVVDQPAAAHVHQERAPFDVLERLTADETGGVGRERRREHYDVAPREQLEQAVGRQGFVDRRRERQIHAPPDRRHPQPERRRHARHFDPDRPDTDDGHAPAEERANRSARFDFVEGPDVRRLASEDQRELTGQRDGDT